MKLKKVDEYVLNGYKFIVLVDVETDGRAHVELHKIKIHVKNNETTEKDHERYCSIN